MPSMRSSLGLVLVALTVGHSLAAEPRLADEAALVQRGAKLHASDEAEVAHFIPDNKQVCAEGPLEYLQAKLPKLKVSPLAAAYANSEVVSGSCASVGYNDGKPKDDKCFPQMTIHFSKEHAFNPFSEIMTIAKYGRAHGGPAVSAGMKDVCA
mmetsp:Transcript_5258/g.10704  ORF Transcript_5258/g.10704 Transcript_5258/m.10704 type:complete len:153 (+) Transcript_5258:2-460(+)